MFKYKGKERMLERCCGTPPYVAPEVLFRYICFLFLLVFDKLGDNDKIKIFSGDGH